MAVHEARSEVQDSQDSMEKSDPECGSESSELTNPARRSCFCSPTAEGTRLGHFLGDFLKGISQVCFISHRGTGLIFLLGIFIGTLRGGILALLGGIAATTMGVLLGYWGVDDTARKEGLLGYNGVLIGCALAVFMKESLLNALLATIAGAGLSAVCVVALSRLLKTQLTMVFNPITLVILACTHLWADHPDEDGKSSVLFNWKSDFPDLTALDCAQAMLNGVAQIFLVCNPTSGLIMVLGICLASPLAAQASLVGSLAAALGCAACGVDLAELPQGLWTFNGALIGMFTSCRFKSLGYVWVSLLVCVGSAAATATYAGLLALTRLSHGFAAAPFTLPTCIVAFLLIALETATQRISKPDATAEVVQ